MEALLREIRQAVRVLRKRPAFPIVCVVTLALGIGANTAIFSIVHAVLLRQLPFANAERLVWISGVRPEHSKAPFSLPDFLDYRDGTRSLDSLSALANWSPNLTGQGDPERITGVRVSGNLFETMGVSAAAGRALKAEDDVPSSPRVVVITHALWQRRFGGDAGLIGKALDLNGDSYTVVGVLPPQFLFPIPGAELAVPLVPDADPRRFDRDSVNFLRLVGRVRAGATLKQAQSEMNALALRLRQEFPEPNAQKIGVKLTPMRDEITGSYRQALWVLMAAVGLVLLIACANLANLNLVRASARRKEMSIRSALGASPRHIMRQLLIESALIAIVGGVLGIVLAFFGLKGLLTLTPAIIPRASGIRLDDAALIFTLVISASAAIITGLAPALLPVRGDLTRDLNQGVRGSTEGARGKTLRTAFVIVEVSLSLVLLAGAGILLKSFAKLQSVDPGFDPHAVLTVRLSLSSHRYSRLAGITQFYDALLERVQALPGVSAAGVINMLPLSGAMSSVPFTIVGRDFSREQFPEAQYRVVTPGYLRVMRIPLLAGREFSEGDTEHTRLVCHINENLARHYWPSGGAIGAHILIDDPDYWSRQIEIVGIIPNVKDRGLETSPAFDVYVPLRQAVQDSVPLIQGNQYWVVRTQRAPLAMVESSRDQVRVVDPEVAASGFRDMDQYVALALAPRRFNLQLLSFFALAALALAMAGIYGLVSYSVSQRLPEIGVRMAIGAQRSDVLRMIVVEGMKPVLAGLGFGLVSLIALSRVLSNLLFAVSAHDPATLGGVSVLFCGIALAAIVMPAWRAAKVDPLHVLRAE
jgi:putative ABC transport system permease protein